MDHLNHLKEQLNRCCPGLELRPHEPLARHTSFHIGGPAALMALPSDREQAVAAVRTALELGVEPFFMGNGSNLLVPDEGVERFIIKSAPGLNRCRREENVLVAEGGITLARLAVFARDEALSGLEFAHGIPGTLGGAVTMNAGAYDGEMAQVVREVTCIDRSGRIEVFHSFGFGYRRSIFISGDRLILEARLELQSGERARITAYMEELAARRQSKQPLEYPSAGSMFKRPEGYFAAALIDQCGLKGLQIGGAQVSQKHAGFVVNRGGATCRDVLQLVEQVKACVLERTGVELEMEVKVLR